MKLFVKLIAVIITIVILAICSTTAFAVSLYIDGDYTYADIDSYNVALYAYDGDNSTLVVPEAFSGRYVSEIYAYAFENNTGITGLDFSQNGNRLKVINTKAFNECTELCGDLILPSSIRTLGFAAFQGCVNLESLTVNYGVAEIPAQCFNRCSGLREITLAPSVESIGNLAFAKCTSLDSVVLPTSVTYISTSAFDGNHPTLYVYYDSYSHHFAEDYGYRYVILDPENIPTEPPTEPEPTEVPTEPMTEAPTEVMTEVPTESNGYYLGDVDNNGTVDILDVAFLQRGLANIELPDFCDMTHGNVDGVDPISIIDATYIQRFLVGLGNEFPIGEWINL